MRVAFLVRHFPALSETFVLSQMTGLIDRGHEVDVFAESPREALSHPDVARYGLASRAHYWPAIPAATLPRWLKGVTLLLREASRRPRVLPVMLNVAAYGRQSLNMRLAYAAWPARHGRRYDILQCHFGPLGIQGMALREMGALAGRLVTAFHGYDLSRLVRGGGRRYTRLFERGDLFLPVSERWGTRLIELGCPPGKVAVHRMGIDPGQFAFRVRPAEPDGTIRLVSVARLVEKKGLDVAIRAVAALAADGRRVEYTIVGDGPLAGDLARQARDLRVDDRVRFAGTRSQPDVVSALDGAHMVVAPSVTASDGDEEGIPVVLMEAMAMGLPVVATRHSGIPELVQDGVSGRLVPERDVRALAAAIADIASNPGAWPAMGEAGRARVVASHNIQTLNDELVARYQRLLR